MHYGPNGRVAKLTSTSSSTDPLAVSYVYNSSSQHVLKTDARNAGVTITEHTFYSDEDGTSPLGFYSSRRSSNSAVSAGEMDSTEILYLPTSNGLMPVAAQINGRLCAIDTDHLNTPRRLTGTDGNVAWQWLITGFGELTPTTEATGYLQPGSIATSQSYAPAVTFNLRYPGQQWHQESGLAYNINRYYDASSGRYIQANPIGLDGGWNRFVYVGGNPLQWTDPLGLAVKCETIAQIPLIADIQKCTENGTTPTEQDALDAKRMTDRELDKACRANGYEDAHAFKKDLGLDSKSDIFVEKKWQFVFRTTQGFRNSRISAYEQSRSRSKTMKIDFQLLGTLVTPKDISKRTGIKPHVELLRGERNNALDLPRQNLWSIGTHSESDEVKEHWMQIESILNGAREEIRKIAETGMAKLTIVLPRSDRIPSLQIPVEMSAFAGYVNAIIDIDHLQ